MLAPAIQRWCHESFSDNSTAAIALLLSEFPVRTSGRNIGLSYRFRCWSAGRNFANAEPSRKPTKIDPDHSNRQNRQNHQVHGPVIDPGLLRHSLHPVKLISYHHQQVVGRPPIAHGLLWRGRCGAEGARVLLNDRLDLKLKISERLNR